MIELYTKEGKRIYRKEYVAKNLNITLNYLKQLNNRDQLKAKGWQVVKLTNKEYGYIKL